MGLKEIGCERADRILVAFDRDQYSPCKNGGDIAAGMPADWLTVSVAGLSVVDCHSFFLLLSPCRVSEGSEPLGPTNGKIS